MATCSPNDDSIFLFRLMTLVIDGGTHVVRNIFNYRLNNVPLGVFLTNEKTRINHLRVQNVITKAQNDLLSPPSGQQPNSVDFDLTLLICLLTSLPSLGLKMTAYSRIRPPGPTDMSIEADLFRVRMFRNEIAHTVSTHCLDEPTFKQQWTNIENCLLRLNNGPHSDQNLKTTIDGFMNSSLDPATEQRLAEQWKALEKSLESDVKLMMEDIATIKENIQGYMQNKDNSTSQNLPREEDVREKLQEELIHSYRSQHREMSLSPLTDQRSSVLHFYQMPNLLEVKVKRERGVATEQRYSIDTWSKLIYKANNTLNGATYICAEAGLGKTTFSKRLALTWCQTKKPIENENDCYEHEQLEAVSGFRFVFMLLLRESPDSKCDIADLIWEQLICKLLRRSEIQRADLENILFNDKCLVILDGLDEWTHPSTCSQRESIVPHWNKRDNVAVITTTRPWKFNVARLKAGDFDQKIELTGLKPESVKKLKYAFLSYFKKQELNVECLSDEEEKDVETDVYNFTQAISTKHASKLETVPLLLMYMLFLWNYRLGLGETQCDLYCRIVELLLSRTFNIEQMRPITSPENIPPCFSRLEHCKRFYSHLQDLGQLAYETLLRESKKENTLVFDSSVAKKYLSEENLNLCLKTGIISQTKRLQIDPVIPMSTVSFSHKTVQEYFAALYMYSKPNVTEMSQLVLSKCKSVEDILNMSKIIMFISGMNVHVAALISSDAMKIINEDEVTQRFRNTSRWMYRHTTPLKDLQNMFVSCCKEMPRDNTVNMCLQDVFIDWRCNDQQERENLQMLVRNKHVIKSVYIDMEGTTFNTVKNVVEDFALNDLKNVVKISCCHGNDTESITPVLNKEVQCLELDGVSSSQSLWNKVTSLKNVKIIILVGFRMSPRELKLLYDYISKRVYIRQIELWKLRYPDEKKDSTDGARLDLSKLSQMRKLTLSDIPLSELNVNMVSLEKCKLGFLSLCSLRFPRVTCGAANSKQNVTSFEFFQVTAPASVVRDFVDAIKTLPQTVIVEIMKCDIKSEEEWESLKQELKTSPHFIVNVDINDLSKPEFKFETPRG